MKRMIKVTIGESVEEFRSLSECAKKFNMSCGSLKKLINGGPLRAGAMGIMPLDSKVVQSDEVVAKRPRVKTQHPDVHCEVCDRTLKHWSMAYHLLSDKHLKNVAKQSGIPDEAPQEDEADDI